MPEIDSPPANATIDAPRSRVAALNPLNSGWVWMTIACVLVGAAGLVRGYNHRRIGLEKQVTEPCPFPLSEIPTRLGEWTSRPELDVKLDDDTVRITGSTDHFLRTYINNLTGVKFSLLLLYGPAEPVLPHTPEVCYPATGYALEGKLGEDSVPCRDGSALFRTATYRRSGSISVERVRVYHSFRFNEKWAPGVEAGNRFYRSNPGIFKIQVQRPMMTAEQGKNEPMTNFLELLLAEIERKVDLADTKAETTTASR